MPIFFGVVLLLLGCTPVVVEPTALPPTETATVTATPTATIDWFPATITPTLFPTPERTPTPDNKPEVGELLVADDFSEDEDWSLREIEDGKITISNNHITLALNRPDGLIFAVRPEPVFDDVYAEVSADLNFCQGVDEYGLMVRVTGNRLNHYRLSLSCEGQARALRVTNDRGTLIEDWVEYPFIPSGFPAQSRLAVWMKGTTLRFFVNDLLVFEINDPVIRDGAFGVFVFGSGDGPISVNFSDLEIYALEEGE
jgi:hypothetical protein